MWRKKEYSCSLWVFLRSVDIENFEVKQIFFTVLLKKSILILQFVFYIFILRVTWPYTSQKKDEGVDLQLNLNTL